MSLVLSIDNITAVTCRLNYASITGGPTSIEVQISPRDDFAFCVAPIFTTTTATPQTMTGINQAQTYFARARGVTSGGVQLGWSNTVMFRTPLSAAQDLTPPANFLDAALICIPATLQTMEVFSPITGYPADNVLDDGPGYALSAGTGGGNAGHNFSFFTAGQPIDTVALLMTNLTEAATVQVISANTKADALGSVGSAVIRYSGVARASANVPGRIGYHGLYRFTETTQPWFNIAINATLPGARLQVTHLVAGKSIVSKKIARDMNTSLEDLGIIERNLFGVPDRQEGAKTRVVDFDLANLDETIYETLYGPIHQRVGHTDPVLVVPNPKAGSLLHDRILYGNLQGGRVTNPVGKLHTRRFQINSII